MASDVRTPVVLCWHMHQPCYQDLSTGEFLFPWVYLHSIKDYSDMAAHIESQPVARAVVNFAPTLLEQIETYLLQIEQWRYGKARLVTLCWPHWFPRHCPKPGRQPLSVLWRNA